jgi:hypothetical protein
MMIMSESLILWNWRVGYALGTDIANPWVSDVPSLRFLLLMLVALGMLIFGFWRFILGFRQIKQFVHKIRSKKGRG